MTRFKQYSALVALGLALGLTVLAVAQQGYLLYPSALSLRTQGPHLTPAGAGAQFAAATLDVNSAVAWQFEGGGGAVFVPTAAPEGGGGNVQRVQLAQIEVGQTIDVGALFEVFAAESGSTALLAGGGTVSIKRESVFGYVFQLTAQVNGQKALLLSNAFSLSAADQAEIAAGGEVTVQATPRAGDNAIRSASMTLRIVDYGVLIAHIAMFTP